MSRHKKQFTGFSGLGPGSGFSRKTLAIAALSWLIGAWSVPLSANEYWKQFGKQPVQIQQVNNGATQTLNFVDFKDGMLVAILDGGVGEISLPVSESIVPTLRLKVEIMPQANAMIGQGNYEGALSLLRPKVYPLIKFHQIPEAFIQLHVPLRTLINTLISAEHFSEAEDVLARISLDKVGTKYSESAIRLINAYILEEDYQGAARVAGTLPVQGIYAVNIRPLVDAADALRGAGCYDAVIPLYREIEKAVPDDVRKNVRMWLAYSLVLANRLEEATPIIDALEEPAPKDRLFSLYKLLQGSREYRNEHYGKALDVLTRGFVRAQTSYSWVPEMLYLIGDCYARSNDTTAARNVWTEISVLYPDSPWATRAEASLKQLPKPEPSN